MYFVNYIMIEMITSLGVQNVDWRYVTITNEDGTRSRVPQRFGMVVGNHNTAVGSNDKYCR